jgi:hypothetical protein
MKHPLLFGMAVGIVTAGLGFLPISRAESLLSPSDAASCACRYDDGSGEMLGAVPPGCGALNVLVLFTSTQDGICAHSGCTGPASECRARASVLVESLGGCFIEFYRDTTLLAFSHDFLGIRLEDKLACEEFVDWFVNVGGVEVVRFTNICRDCTGG